MYISRSLYAYIYIYIYTCVCVYEWYVRWSWNVRKRRIRTSLGLTRTPARLTSNGGLRTAILANLVVKRSVAVKHEAWVRGSHEGHATLAKARSCYLEKLSQTVCTHLRWREPFADCCRIERVSRFPSHSHDSRNSLRLCVPRSSCRFWRVLGKEGVERRRRGAWAGRLRGKEGEANVLLARM